MKEFSIQLLGKETAGQERPPDRLFLQSLLAKLFGHFGLIAVSSRCSACPKASDGFDEFSNPRPYRCHAFPPLSKHFGTIIITATAVNVTEAIEIKEGAREKKYAVNTQRLSNKASAREILLFFW